MSRAIRWFDEAIDDLVEHVTYVATESPQSAQRIAIRIREVAEALAEFAIGRPGLVPGTFERVLVDVPYTIVYAIDEDDGLEVISILRVMHQAQSWPPQPIG